MTNNKQASRQKKSSNKYEIEIVFNNKPAPEAWRDFEENVIGANMREHIPAHLQRPLLDKFIESGLMAP